MKQSSNAANSESGAPVPKIRKVDEQSNGSTSDKKSAAGGDSDADAKSEASVNMTNGTA